MAEQLTTPAPYVFLSYSSTDREQTFALADRLEAAGIRVWVDRRSLVGGMSWDAAIVRAIKDCKVFAVMCTPASVTSPNVIQELRLAWDERRPTLPVLLAAVTFPDEMRYILTGRQWVELLARPEDEWLPDLLNALAGMGVAPAAPQAAARVVPPPAAGPLTNLPAPLTNFVGREEELAAIRDRLATRRLVTLTGPGGTGKTRLAIEAARGVVLAFPDGVFFVDLAPHSDPDLVPSAVAQVLEVPERTDVSVRESISRMLRDKRLLLVLDNYEHLLAAAPFVGGLLQTVPELKVLATSRAPLRIPGEWEYPVAPLPLPDERQTRLAEVQQNPAVALFVVRAQAVRPDFVLTDENAVTVATICARLDGLPLAIELAAARVRVLPPAALLARLTQRLALLTGGGRTAPARQQTLRGAIVWSYASLEPAEQTLFRRLGVFAGGCTLELAESVCNADGDLGLDLLDGVSSLVEKSLLREGDGQAGEPRYRMLETIREFALGELEASGEAEVIRRQLAVQVLQLARQNSTLANWMRLDVEVDNARAVLSWCLERSELGVGVRLWRAVRDYLLQRGHGREEEQWRQRLLALPEAGQPNLSRAMLLAIYPLSSFLSIVEQERAAASLEESIVLSRTLGDRRCLAVALHLLSLLRSMQGRYEAIPAPAEEALALQLEIGAVEQARQMRSLLIEAAMHRGDFAAAEALVAANRALALETGEGWRSGVGDALLAEARGDDARARLLWEALVEGSRTQQGERSPMTLHGLAHLARVAMRQGDTSAAVAVCARLLAVYRAIGPSRMLPAALNLLARAAERCGRLGESARLLAAVDMLRRAFATEIFGLAAEQQAAVERVRVALGQAGFAEAWAAGEALSADASIELGLAVVEELQQMLATDTVTVPPA